MNIIVCVKQVSDPEAPPSAFKIDAGANKVVPPPGMAPVISTFDEYAVEAALRVKEKAGGKITVLSMGTNLLFVSPGSTSQSGVHTAQGSAMTLTYEDALALNDPGPYQVQAAISALHAEALTAEATDWRQIAALYDTLAVMKPSLVVEVNRAVAVAMAYGASVGLQRLIDLEDQADGYYPYHAARADLLRRTGQREAAAEAYEQALTLCSNSAERAYLQRRLDEMLKYPTHSS